MRRLTRKEYVLIGLFTMIAAFPLATAPDGDAPGELPYSSLMDADWLTGDTSVHTGLRGAAGPMDTMSLTARERSVIGVFTADGGCPMDMEMILTPMCRPSFGRGGINPMGSLMR